MSLYEAVSKVRQFHEHFDCPRSCIPTPGDFRLRRRRALFLREEVDEYEEARSLTEVLDAITDQLYFILGTAVAHGLDDVLDEAFNEVHRSNMSKAAPDGSVMYDDQGKVMKGENYHPPDLESVLDGA